MHGREEPHRHHARAASLAVCALACALLAAHGVAAATISAIPYGKVIASGQTTEIDIVLDLGPGEVASVFEGYFDLVGAGSVVEPILGADVVAGGPTWGSSFGGVVGSQIVVSLTSSNLGGSRLVARISVTGLAFGNFEIRLASGTFAQRDIAGPPFVQNVPITTPIGATLVTVGVDLPPEVPALGAPGLLVLATSLLGCARIAIRSRG